MLYQKFNSSSEDTLSAKKEFSNTSLPKLDAAEDVMTEAEIISDASIPANPSHHSNNGSAQASDDIQRQVSEEERISLVAVSEHSHPDDFQSLLHGKQLDNPNKWVIPYDPPPTALKMHQSQAFSKCLLGPLGSGKSSSCCIEIIYNIFKQNPGPDGIRRSRVGILRNSYPMLIQTTLQTWRHWCPDAVWHTKMTAPPVTHIQQRLADNTEIDAEIIWIACDIPQDVKRLLSLELSGAWLNEAKELPREIFDMIQGRVGRYPPKSLGGNRYDYVLIDSNPPDRSHWIPEIFLRGHPDFQLFKQPSGLSDASENLSNLPDGYYTRLQIGKSKNWIKSNIEGDFAPSGDGKTVWGDDFDTDTHVLKQDVQPPRGTRLVAGLDFGLSPAISIGWAQPNGQLYLVGELIAERAGILSFASDIKRYMSDEFPGCTLDIYGDPSGTAQAMTDQKTVFDILAAQGLNAMPCHTNDVDLRLESVRMMLQQLVHGEGWMQCNPKLINTIAVLGGSYKYARLQTSGTARYSDKPLKDTQSHLADAIQYLVLSLNPAAYIDKLILAKDHGYTLELGHILATTPLDKLVSRVNYVPPLKREVFCLANQRKNKLKR